MQVISQEPRSNWTGILQPDHHCWFWKKTYVQGSLQVSSVSSVAIRVPNCLFDKQSDGESALGVRQTQRSNSATVVEQWEGLFSFEPEFPHHNMHKILTDRLRTLGPCCVNIGWHIACSINSATMPVSVAPGSLNHNMWLLQSQQAALLKPRIFRAIKS